MKLPATQTTLKGVSGELMELIDNAARKEGLKKSEWMRRVIRAAVEREQNPPNYEPLLTLILAQAQQIFSNYQEMHARTTRIITELHTSVATYAKIQYSLGKSRIEIPPG